MQPLNRNASRMQSAAVASDWGVGGSGGGGGLRVKFRAKHFALVQVIHGRAAVGAHGG